jgi:hypothetical protein
MTSRPLNLSEAAQWLSTAGFSRDDFVDDAEIARRWCVSIQMARVAILALERNDPRFPKRDQLFGGKRYWPAVKAFMDVRYGLNIRPPQVLDGPENLNAKPSDPRHPRLALAAQK